MQPVIATTSLAAAALALLLDTASVRAQGESKIFCSEPVTPFCTNSETVFDDETERERCGDEVAAYVEGMHEYVACLDTQQNEALERAKLLQERFACMTAGREDCR